MTPRYRLCVPIAALAAVGILSGCGDAGLSRREDAASVAAVRFSASLENRDAAAGCRMLAPPTRDELESSAGMSCVEAIEEEEIPSIGSIRDINVYGQQAMVAGTGDTVFLTDVNGAWSIMAAGCQPRAGRAYECVLESG